ncbi:hypothetical protein PYCCODRAFT_1377275 [Trametes coccinea BRFM310]|uniref:Uncharacterized protein n=1 Tax=Trametes coccinea (strain BRFM310) TaxID=1353009 RepID=A0A1Y2I8E2_TRAC3|nr:hypothetical protein PYCCODRAFT_1377275 [Trametes coccinea BRFM310]
MSGHTTSASNSSTTSRDANIRALLDGIDDYTPYLPLWIPSSYYTTRLKPLLDYRGPGNAYSLSEVPTVAHWGSGTLAPFLTFRGRPLNIVVIGVLQSITATVDQSTEVTYAQFRLELLRDRDQTSYAALLRRARNVNEPIPAFFETVRIDKQSLKLFSRVHNARQSFATNTDSPRLPLSDLAVGDLVAVECYVVREDCSGNATPTWLRFRCRFITTKLSVLAQQSDPIPST